MLREFSPQALFMGLLAAFVGFASSFAVILQGLRAMGASDLEAASGLMALSIAMGLGGIALSIAFRMPISVAWTTPGAALLATAGLPGGGFSHAVGAFVVCGLLIVISGLFRPLGRAVASIPVPLANAMLAGVLVNLCFAPIKAIGFNPWLGLPIVAAWALVGAFKRLLAIPAALAAFGLVLAFGVDIPADAFSRVAGSILPNPVFVMPEFDWTSMVSIALPLFIVTMASQNIPGITVLRVHGYEPPPGPLFATTGVFSVLAAFFGGIAVNLAAITAAMCAGEDAHRDPQRRYWSGIVAGITYVLFGLLAGAVTGFVSLAPPILIEAVAGLALVGAFSNASMAAYKEPETREAAAVTFLVTASGISFAGISGAFWGLLAGGAMMGLMQLRKRF